MGKAGSIGSGIGYKPSSEQQSTTPEANRGDDNIGINSNLGQLSWMELDIKSVPFLIC